MSKINRWSDHVETSATKIVAPRKRWVDSVSVKKGKPPVYNMFNYNDVSRVGEVNRFPSMTIPDGTLSMRELVQRHMRGLSVPGSRFEELPWDEVDGVMSDMAEMPNVYRMSYQDRVEAIRAVQNSAEGLHTEVNAAITESVLKRAKNGPKKDTPVSGTGSTSEPDSTNIT